MSLREEGYLPAMVKPGGGVSTSQLRDKWEAVWWFYQNASETLPEAILTPLWECDVEVTAVLSAIAGGAFPPVFMRDLGRKLTLENPPASIPTTLFSAAVPAPAVFPDSWTALMVSAAKAANVLAGNPVLNGGPFGV